MYSKLTVVFISTLFLLLQACSSAQKVPTQPKPASLVGTWQFVSGRYTEPNKQPVAYKDPELRAIKIITPTHFSYITETGNGSFYIAGAGTCKLEKDQYTETLEYVSAPKMKNKSYSFKYHIENDLWYTEGMEDGSLTEEIWQRLPE